MGVLLSSTHKKSSLAGLTVAAVGIVYGDIGTSPLYAIKEVFAPAHGVDLNPANLMGVISLVIWSLIVIVSLKYVTLMLRANNHGEGGIMALLALTLSSVGKTSRAFFPLMVVGLLGAALFFGDGVITPAISVLSAVEGLEVATPAFKPYVVPLTILLLTLLYLLQKQGTAGIGKWFGPVMLLWFAALALMGLHNIIQSPSILGALNPLHALAFAQDHPMMAFIALGAVVLTLTGAEALYADMGHFGVKPVRLAWFLVVFPALALNYLGQGGLLLQHPEAISNPFFKQLGAWSIYPLVGLSTVATIIASQATISGTYSMVKQAIALGFLPRMKIIHTSIMEMGQIYIPLVNWVQWGVVVVAVFLFQSSSNLAAAYGIAVTGTMMATTILTFFIIRYGWKYNLALCITATGIFFFIDALYFSANIVKVLHGGWLPLFLAAIMFLIMTTWKRGRELVRNNLQKHAIPLQDFLTSLFTAPPMRVPGIAIFMRGPGDGIPHAMLHNLSHNKVLHERVVFLTVYEHDVPFLSDSERLSIEDLGHNCYQLDLHYGFKDEADIPRALELPNIFNLEFNMLETSFFIARQTVIATPGSGMAFWRERLFVWMSRNARDAADFYKIPTNRVIELGTQVEI